jgi:hypothetical protein
MSSSRIAWRIIIVALIAASWSAYGSLVHSASLGSTQILMRIDASGSVPQTGIAPAWLICNGRLTKTGDVGGVFSGKATPPFVTGATRIQSTVKLLKPTQGHRMIGFALYRSWASPHWLQVESYGAATDCDGPWRGPVDGRGLLYGTRSPGARVPPGRYYLSFCGPRLRPIPTPCLFCTRNYRTGSFSCPYQQDRL